MTKEILLKQTTHLNKALFPNKVLIYSNQVL